MTTQFKRAADMDIIDGVQFRRHHILERLLQKLASIVDQDIDRPMAFRYPCLEGGQRTGGGDIQRSRRRRGRQDSVTACSRTLARRPATITVAPAACRHRAMPSPIPAAAAGDQGDLAVQAVGLREGFRGAIGGHLGGSLAVSGARQCCQSTAMRRPRDRG